MNPAAAAAHTAPLGTHEPPKAPQSLKEVRRQRRLLEARLELQQVQRLQRVLESSTFYGDGWGSLVDPRDSLRGDPDFRPAFSTQNLPTDRSHGQNWPLFRVDTDLDRFRQASNVLVGTNAQAQGLLRNLTNYTIGTGFRYKAVGRRKRPKDRKAVKRLCAQTQDVIDHFTGAEDPEGVTTWAQREREVYRRRRRDGDAFLRFFGRPDGTTEVRFVEPVLVRNPSGAVDKEGRVHHGTEQEGWSFGVRHLVRPDGSEDVETITHYCVWAADGSGRQEVVPADEIVHFKNGDTDSTVKRGLPDFIFDTFDAFDRAGTLQRYVSVAAKVQAATAEIQQFDTATRQGATDFRDANAFATRTNVRTGETESLEHYAPGSVRRIPKGMTFVTPSASNSEAHLSVVQADLRTGLSPFSAPEYFTADASNADYSSTKEAGAPFVKSGQAEQEQLGKLFRRCLWKVIKHAVKRGVLPPEVLDEVRLQIEAPHVLIKDPLAQAQTDEILIDAGVKDPQTASMEWGLDPETVARNLAEKPVSAPTPPGGGAKTEGRRRRALRQLGLLGLLESGGLLEVADKTGHEHDAKGLFTAAKGAHAAAKQGHKEAAKAHKTAGKLAAHHEKAMAKAGAALDKAKAALKAAAAKKKGAAALAKKKGAKAKEKAAALKAANAQAKAQTKVALAKAAHAEAKAAHGQAAKLTKHHAKQVVLHAKKVEKAAAQVENAKQALAAAKPAKKPAATKAGAKPAAGKKPAAAPPAKQGPPKPAAAKKTAKGPQPPEPGFSGTDAHGHHWVNGQQVSQQELGAHQAQAKANAPAVQAHLQKLSPHVPVQKSAQILLKNNASLAAAAHALGLKTFEVKAALQHLAVQPAAEPPAPKAAPPAHDETAGMSPAQKVQYELQKAQAVHAALGAFGVKPETVNGNAAMLDLVANHLSKHGFPGTTPAEVQAAIVATQNAQGQANKKAGAATGGAAASKMHHGKHLQAATVAQAKALGLDPAQHGQFTDKQVSDILAGLHKQGFQDLAPFDVKGALLLHDEAAKPKLPYQGTKPLNGPNKNLSDHARPPLKQFEAQALKDYSGSSYASVNQALRDGKPFDGLADEKTHQGLQAAFAQTKPLAEPVVAKRGIKLEGKDLEAFIGAVKAAQSQGGVLRLPGYTSTSVGGTGFAGNVRVLITAKQGLDMKPYSSIPHENELLLDHNSSFKVQGVKQGGDGTWHVQLEQLLPGEAPPPDAPAPKMKSWWEKVKGAFGSWS